MGPEFFQTGMGQKFFNQQLPSLINALTRIADALEKPNSVSPVELSQQTKEMVYREVRAEYVAEDIAARAEERGINPDELDVDGLAERYVYDGDYDCNLSYWDNIDNLIDSVAR